MIVRIPRDETENFETKVWKDLSYEEQISIIYLKFTRLKRK